MSLKGKMDVKDILMDYCWLFALKKDIFCRRQAKLKINLNDVKEITRGLG